MVTSLPKVWMAQGFGKRQTSGVMTNAREVVTLVGKPEAQVSHGVERLGCELPQVVFRFHARKYSKFYRNVNTIRK